MRLLRLAAAGVSLGLLLCSGSGVTSAAAPPGRHTVTIDGTRFTPEELTINLGDSVMWVNRDPFPHTATSKAAGFDSKAIGAGESWKVKPGTRGDFEYVCTFHPTMKARLHVR